MLLSYIAAPVRVDGQQTRWETLRSPTDVYRFEDVYFITREVGWVVSFEGAHQTQDGGRSWTSHPTPTKVLRSVVFADRATGWIGSLNPSQVLLETRDSGATWEDITDRIHGADVPGICALTVVTDSIIVGVGRYSGPAVVVRSVDRGATWYSAPIGAGVARLIDIHFVNESEGIAVGGTSLDTSGRAVILRTTDGGLSWGRVHVSRDTAEWAWKISFPTASIGYVAVESTERGKVLKTSDGGRTWSELLIPGGRDLQGIGFLSESEGWAGGPVGTWHTHNGGVSWEPVPRPPAPNRFRLLDGLLYVAGADLVVYSHRD